MSEFKRDIYGVSNVHSRLYLPGYAKYVSDYKTSSARSYTGKIVFECLNKSGRFVSMGNKTYVPEKSYFESISFDNEDDAKIYDEALKSMTIKKNFAHGILKNHSLKNIKAKHRWGSPDYRRLKISAPITNRKLFLENYKTSFTISPSKPINDLMVYDIANYIWNFFVKENYPVDDYLFQCFCMEYYFDKKDVLNQGLRIYFKSEGDAAQFSFSLMTLYGNTLDVF